MKYEITKGSEKDFDLAPEWATLKERNTSGEIFFSEGHSVGCRVQGITTEHDFTIDDGNNDFTHLTLIAERRPITEPELKPIYGDGIHDDSDALQQRIDMGIDINNIIGEQGKLFNISRLLQFKSIIEPVWSGEGLPPVGVECEFECNDEGFNVGTVRHIGKRLVIIELDGDENCYGREFLNFRPIRSPEDVAREKERSEQCDKIFGILSGVEPTGNRIDMAEALYDAGYRKVE